MEASGDPRGFYSRLGVEPSASAEEIRSAFRNLAKKLHPDINRDANAKNLFQAINEAYTVLSNPDSRAEYGALQYSKPRPAAEEVLEPICCSRCGKIAAQPRSTVFYRVVSIVLMTTRTPIQGIFCSACAKKTALRASFVSGLFGWWGFPLGPIWTIGSIIGNARGGTFSKEVDEKLLWYNAIAFLSKGKLAMSYALAQQARKASNEDIALNALNLMDRLRESGVPVAATPLKNPWRNQPRLILTHFLMLVAAPAIVAILIYSDNTTRSITRPNLPRAVALTPALSQPLTLADLVPNSSIAPSIKRPTCLTPPINGQILVRTTPFDKDGHVIEIQNGSVANAVVKVRNALTEKLTVSFFVERGKTASIAGLPDGEYRIQYAFGSTFSPDCRSLYVNLASQFPNAESLYTRFTPTQIIRSHLSYTLLSTPSGNLQPEGLNVETFNND